MSKPKSTKYRPKINESYKDANVAFMNWLSQMCTMIMPKRFAAVLGRGSAKTTDIIAERLIEMAYDMPGAPIAWVADTYSNLQKNVLPSIMEGLERKGYKEGVHYILGKEPPKFKQSELEGLDPSIREHFWKPYNKLATYKHTLIFFTGLNITFGSLDKPASLAGRSYVHVIGDEVKYFPEAKIENILRANRGYAVKYAHSVFYLGQTFTTDMPNTGRIGEYDWILKQGKKMDKEGILRVLKTAMVYNECVQERLYYQAKGDKEETAKKLRTELRWLEMWKTVRKHKSAHNFFWTASSLVNIDILTPDWFIDAINTDLGDPEVSVLGLRPQLSSGERFYANISADHFYDDGLNPRYDFGIAEMPDCRELKYLDRNKAIDLGMDFGNMISMSVAQANSKDYRILKFIHTLSPNWIPEIAKEFLTYFKTQKEKTINLYYDRAANNYKEAGVDLASAMKKALEYESDGKTKTGWKVNLMSLNQGNIGQFEEFVFMQELLSGSNPKLPKVMIDRFQCKFLKASIEGAKTKIVQNSKGQSITAKDKSSEKLELERLPMESTNASDSFKYLMMRRLWRNIVRIKPKSSVMSSTVR
ncbi:hypothetical protein AAW12_15975 [Sphingobacterium sp. Ag1]|uniref:hypothetical protein n=1 Tax=Sphingobacterium sp. Ag1 TaxID=1643451 RepID=UPI000627DB45|nr:hypothetical protein [Sphingobacterium sp. Ag1]KKO90574.1 hypothetical protein AAW12_15975 [Sphingobacterium sp. Ag1]